MNELDRKNALYLEACSLMNSKDYITAAKKFEELGSWLDSKEKLLQCQNYVENPPADFISSTSEPVVHPQKEPTDSKSLKLLIGIIGGVIVIVLIIILIIVLGNSDKMNSGDKSSVSSTDGTSQSMQDENKTNHSIANSNLQANLSSWGMACMVNDDLYFSDMDSGIYINNRNTLFVSGVYSDICCLNGKLVCIEYYNVQETETSSSQYSRLVIFDVQTKEKTTAFSSPTGDDYLVVSNVIGDKVYFTMAENALFTCDHNGNVVDTGIRNVLKVTESGVYTAQYSESGLRVVSFENKEIKSYGELLKYNVVVYFELNSKLYAKVSDDNNETWSFVTIDTNSGDFELISNQDKYGTMTNINFRDDTLYCTFVNIEDNNSTCFICKSELDGTNMEYMKKIQNNDVNTTLNLISAFEDCLYISFPYSGIDSEFIKIN